MKGREVRRVFLDYFKNLGHEVVPSSPLVPYDDPTLLFTNAGMVQFKKVFLGEEKRPYTRATSCQKCVRAGGKHNDLENVGYTARHHTFFEMLGNFSFGDYFKAEAIEFAWKLVTEVFNLPKDRLYVTVFKEDDEAAELWKKIAGISESRIIRLGEKDNFWAMGDTGPCGPCSEIIYDQGEDFGCKKPSCAPGCDCDRFLEIWNLVFMQYERNEKGELKPLPKGCIDTGMGLERITAVLQGVPSNYDTDLFKGIMQRLSEISEKTYKETPETEVAFKVISDHIRAAVFLIAEGIIPSNEGRGYVLRRIIRRAQRFGKVLGLNEPFLYKLVLPVVEEYGDVYSEVKKQREVVENFIKLEEEKFLETLETGLEILEKEVRKLEREGKKVFPGDVLFKLYDTYGFPYDLVRDYVLPKGFSLDVEGFEKLREKAREQSKKSWKGSLEKAPEFVKKLSQQGIKTKFVGYEKLETHGKVIGFQREKDFVFLVFDETPFYPEGGGQVWDTGVVKGESFEGKVVEVKRIGDVIVHKVVLEKGEPKEGEDVLLKVDEERRKHIARHHTATHLLHSALRKVLGSHVRQSGSLVEENRLRFDFTHFKALTKDELKTVEDLVNQWIVSNYEVETIFTSRKKAEELGAIALFEEKYGEEVRVVKVDDVSVELCGGTHVKATGEVGLFKVLNETSVASGIRRIEAVCGLKALDYLRALEAELEDIALELKVAPKDIKKKIQSIFEEVNALKRELKRIKSLDVKGIVEDCLSSAKRIGEITLVLKELPVDKMDTLREIGDAIKSKIDKGVIFLLGKREKGGPLAMCMISKEATEFVSAGELFKALSEIGLKGGGKAHLAQGSFVKPLDLKEVFGKLENILREKVNAK